ncbi:MAG: N-acetylglucosamine-6-phosphate deacetylase [Gomphosphaeria aponina SAG 52.96 = DSM 107014]|uniref:N-acetylglucosamine-6-phosphate deacetylase n=1 Tax=Gomphosphaeria aponina SAG 52.96 = DSM 107014 TaxID=1521640 RepID=A0A941JT89_9CHRO|nr:N-acetylglucosamine-6-phosphate deacetylase [Gomphosphaeria aponina SAG 52.96 = DSM 107014]
MRIINARVPGYKGWQELKLTEGKIAAISPMNNARFSDLDLGGDWLSLGGVDLQINGGLGLAWIDLEREDLPKIEKVCSYLWLLGVDSFLPTLVTTSVEKIKRSLAVMAEFIPAQSEGAAKILGVHLEGPFLNHKKRGAHPAKYLLPLTLENVKEVLGENAEIVKIITLAPELDQTGEVIKYLHSLGIIVSLGHSIATAAEAKTAFKLGASMVTHAFNAMPGLHHREPGLLGEAILNKEVYCGLIADGNHVCPAIIELLLRGSNYDEGIFLVSDALAPLGLGDGIYDWDERKITVKNGTAKLKDGTLAGTTLPLLVGVENLVNWGICEEEKAIALATSSPRKAIGLSGMGVGQPAHNLLRWYWKEGKFTWQRLN